MDDADQCQQLRVGQAAPIRFAAALPGAVAADADLQHGTHFGQGVVRALRVYPGILHSASLAKYAVAFFRISTSRRSRIISARDRQFHLYRCDGLGSRPTQFASVSSFDPVTQGLVNQPQFTGCCTYSQPVTRLTASALNSAVYSCFGIFFILPLPKLTLILRHP